MPQAYISGTGSYHPDNVVTNDDLRDKYGIDTNHEWIVQRTGIEERRFGEAGVNASDLALKASEQAIENAGIDKKDIGMIIFATLSPDRVFPGSGVYLQDKLGLCGKDGTFAPAMDIRNQCSGFLYGLASGASMVQSGSVKHVLLVGAEIHSAALDFSTRGRTVTSLFGDGAGAVVISATDEDRGVREWYLGADGSNAEILALFGWDTKQRPYVPTDEDGVGQVTPDMLWPRMDGKVVFKHAVERMMQSLMKVFQSQNLTIGDVDLFLFHQANLRINEFLQKRMGIPDEKIMNNIQKYGNTTAATLPTLLAEAEQAGRLKRGMKVVLCAFGSGFTWGSAVIDW